MSAESIVEIQQLMHRYCRFVDVGPWSGLRDLFTDWATFDMAGKVLDGKTAILTFYEERSGRPLTSRHVVSNLVVELRGDRDATATSTITLFRETGGPTPVFIGDYVDKLVKEGKTWRFAERVLQPVFNTPPVQPS